MDLGITELVASAIGGIVGTATTLWFHRREYLLQYRSEALVRKLLRSRKWRLRTFKTIKHHVAGFDDNELRQILIRAGALRFEDKYGDEIWGLLERNSDLLDAEYGTKNH